MYSPSVYLAVDVSTYQARAVADTADAAILGSFQADITAGQVAAPTAVMAVEVPGDLYYAPLRARLARLLPYAATLAGDHAYRVIRDGDLFCVCLMSDTVLGWCHEATVDRYPDRADAVRVAAEWSTLTGGPVR